MNEFVWRYVVYTVYTAGTVTLAYNIKIPFTSQSTNFRVQLNSIILRVKIKEI